MKKCLIFKEIWYCSNSQIFKN